MKDVMDPRRTDFAVRVLVAVLVAIVILVTVRKVWQRAVAIGLIADALTRSLVLATLTSEVEGLVLLFLLLLVGGSNLGV